MKILVAFAIMIGVSETFQNNALADLYDVPKVQSVMDKKYYTKDEITAQFGFLPRGAFSKYLGFGGTYCHAFSDFTTWEIVNGMYTLELPAGLKKDLIANFNADPNSFGVSTFLVTSNLLFSPLYTKNLLFNSSIVYSQFSFALGGGVAGFNIATIPTIDAGLILRFFLSPKTTLKFDLRYYKFLTSNPTITDNYTLSAGVAFNLGSKRKKGEFGD